MSEISLIQFFFDPILRAPVIAGMLMCLASSLIGVMVFVKRRSLVGEALAHASYPGVIFAFSIAPLFFHPNSMGTMILILMGAFISAWMGLGLIHWLEKRWSIQSDAALCFVLSLFLGVGVFLGSRIQVIYPLWYQQISTFLYGQAATMGDYHMIFYMLFVVGVLFFVIFRFRQIELFYFDPSFAKSLLLKSKGFHILNSVLLILALIIGMRSVGIVLISGMLIMPGAFARQFTHRLANLFIYAGLMGMVSAFLGVYMSVQIPLHLNSTHPISLPTGPMILLTAAFLTLFALIFSPKEGLCVRVIRIRRFKIGRLLDHILKTLWKKGPLSSSHLKQEMALSYFASIYLLFLLKKEGWIRREWVGGQKRLVLTEDGKRKASRLVRLHRLWELYLTSELKVDEKRVHCSAEEMEHILTFEIEAKLEKLLKDPKIDPHHQPIPQKEGLC